MDGYMRGAGLTVAARWDVQGGPGELKGRVFVGNGKDTGHRAVDITLHFVPLNGPLSPCFDALPSRCTR